MKTDRAAAVAAITAHKANAGEVMTKHAGESEKSFGGKLKLHKSGIKNIVMLVAIIPVLVFVAFTATVDNGADAMDASALDAALSIGDVTLSADLTIGSGETVTVPSGKTLETLNKKLTINAGGKLIVDAGGTVAFRGGTGGGCDNAGTIENSGSINMIGDNASNAYGCKNTGTITNNSGGVIFMHGGGAEGAHGCDNAGTIENSGSINMIGGSASNAYGCKNTGTITNKVDATIDAIGGSVAGAHGFVKSDGNVTNNGTVTSRTEVADALGLSEFTNLGGTVKVSLKLDLNGGNAKGFVNDIIGIVTYNSSAKMVFKDHSGKDISNTNILRSGFILSGFTDVSDSGNKFCTADGTLCEVASHITGDPLKWTDLNWLKLFAKWDASNDYTETLTDDDDKITFKRFQNVNSLGAIGGSVEIIGLIIGTNSIDYLPQIVKKKQY